MRRAIDKIRELIEVLSGHKELRPSRRSSVISNNPFGANREPGLVPGTTRRQTNLKAGKLEGDRLSRAKHRRGNAIELVEARMVRNATSRTMHVGAWAPNLGQGRGHKSDRDKGGDGFSQTRPRTKGERKVIRLRFERHREVHRLTGIMRES